jgi:hypothetical protein
VPFTPVCPENSVHTYFSPCHGELNEIFVIFLNFICSKLKAGCGAEIFINNVRVFGNCSCGIDTELPMEDVIATEGGCGIENCQKFWISYQVLSVLASGLLASTFIGKLIITLRSVLPQDKASAIAIELSLVGLIVYIPGKLGYRFIASKKYFIHLFDKLIANDFKF